ncbi:hypothetical protein O7626_14430 [Micromonospora sp. WMMD1102]|uniref:hypothetical protein n=1 Tax=Micromonospora sp. WMMD1102 TaxID=3016105 RepID=UPI002414D964|nr:hypothetical protein [Micromonospora sp. WMMD1102]MDG4787111.1 hypothetical protein [Micromonospora sp. WMMD1102]
MASRLEYENEVVLDALQASLGLISEYVRAVSVQIHEDKITLHFAVHEQNAGVDEDIDEMIFELDALRDGSVRIEASVYVGIPDGAWPGRGGRLLFLSKDLDGQSDQTAFE